jgi:hypothetical protein
MAVALAVPFWAYGAMNGHQLMPGLPMAALMFVCPGLAALILVSRAQGSKDVKALLGRAIDYIEMQILPTLALCLVFFVSALGEELTGRS